MNNSAQLKEGELQLSASFLLMILEMCPSAAFQCTACSCFHKNCVFGKIHAKFVKPWEMKKLACNREKGQWNRVTHGKTVRVERSELSKGYSQNQLPSVCWRKMYIPLKFQARKLIIEVKWRGPIPEGPPALFHLLQLFFILCFAPKTSFGITLKCFLFSLFFVVSL